MKITKRQLKRIIREEYTRVLAENVMSLVKKYASAGTPQTEQIKQAKQDPVYQEFSDAQKLEFEDALENYNDQMMGF
jgi:hypothetical protein